MRGTIDRANIGALATLAAGSTLACLTFVSPAYGAGNDVMSRAERRCGVAILAARAHVQAADTRALGRCALTVLTRAEPDGVDKACRRLRTPLVGIDLVDRRARNRIVEWCSIARPSWLAASCPGPGPGAGAVLATPSDVARCVVGATHCLARRAVQGVIGSLEESVGAENPQNLLFEYGDVGGNSFAACEPPLTSACPE